MAINSLFFSALVLTIINPLFLWDVGFQLSFLATLGLIVLVRPLEQTIFRALQRLLRREQVGLTMALLSELLIVTIAAQLITGPLIVYQFGRFSLVSLLTNLLILPVQPPIMIVGGVAMLAGMIWLPLGQLIGWRVWLPLAWRSGYAGHFAKNFDFIKDSFWGLLIGRPFRAVNGADDKGLTPANWLQRADKEGHLGLFCFGTGCFNGL